MKLKLSIASLILFIFIPMFLLAQNQPPEVTYVNVLQISQAPSFPVTINYHLNDPENGVMNVGMRVSSDNGVNWDFPCCFKSGDIGIGITNGDKTITWQFGDEHPNTTGTYLIEITADDGVGNACPGMPEVVYEGQTYHTVQIGSQCWLRENLNAGTFINATNGGSGGNGEQTDNGIIERHCYANIELNCITSGGLYQWAEAVQYLSTATNTLHPEPFFGNVQGICPCGWHIPSWSELFVLQDYVNNDGNALKDVGTGCGGGAGTNSSGFSALMAGWRNSTLNPQEWNQNGIFTYFISTLPFGYNPPYFPSDESRSYAKHLIYNAPTIGMAVNRKRDSGSVRCLRDEPPITTPETPTLQSPTNNAVDISTPLTLIWNPVTGATSYTLQISSVNDFSSYNEYPDLHETSYLIAELSNSITYYWRVQAINCSGTSDWSEVWSFTTGLQCPGLPTVLYEGQTYNTVQIGNQCWLKENLNVGTMINSTTGGTNNDGNQTNNDDIEKYCYNDDQNNCISYGGYYQWNEAMQYVTTPGTQGICPIGWHIPTEADFTLLKNSAVVGGNSNTLKAEGQGTGDGLATYESGFSALLSGYLDDNGGFSKFGWAFYLSSTEYATNYVYYLRLYYANSDIQIHYYNHVLDNDGYNVRCLKD